MWDPLQRVNQRVFQTGSDVGMKCKVDRVDGGYFLTGTTCGAPMVPLIEPWSAAMCLIVAGAGA
ncbi:hypothetical protein Hanom_Chr08g00737081 [Helianthus anomalus]